MMATAPRGSPSKGRHPPSQASDKGPLPSAAYCAQFAVAFNATCLIPDLVERAIAQLGLEAELVRRTLSSRSRRARRARRHINRTLRRLGVGKPELAPPERGQA